MYTYQDFVNEPDVIQAIATAIINHQNSDDYKTACTADKYDKQQNETITNYVKTIFSLTGIPVEDFTAANNKLASNFFHRLNTQRCMYLLGNGVTFNDHKVEKVSDNGRITVVDETKETLGAKFDNDLKRTAYFALIHKVCFGFWNLDRLYVFPLTEFVPLWDENMGTLRAGIRFWRISKDKPMTAVLYEEDGYTKYRSNSEVGMDFHLEAEKRPYKTVVSKTEADGEEVVGYENYGTLPIVPMWGSDLKQSTLIGMREQIDSYDLIRSGFANDLSDVAEIYWILENYGGMNDSDLAKFRDRLKINHIALADTANGGKVTPFSQDIPYAARQTYLDTIRAGIYEDFGALDVHTIAAGSTNDHIDAAYQPLDEEADDFEYQVSEFVLQILALLGIEDTPSFKRNRISNENERTQMILSAAQYLDTETVLQKLPFITVDEVVNIMAKINEESENRFEAEDEETFE